MNLDRTNIDTWSSANCKGGKIEVYEAEGRNQADRLVGLTIEQDTWGTAPHSRLDGCTVHFTKEQFDSLVTEAIKVWPTEKDDDIIVSAEQLIAVLADYSVMAHGLGVTPPSIDHAEALTRIIPEDTSDRLVNPLTLTVLTVLAEDEVLV